MNINSDGAEIDAANLMTKNKALELALNALHTKGEHHPRVYEAIAAIQTVLKQPEQTFYQPAANEAVEILKSLSYVYEPKYKSCARCLHKTTWPSTSGVCGGCRFYSNFRANLPVQQPPLPVQEPVACRFCHSEKGCWTWQCYSCGEIDDVQKPQAELKERNT